MNFSLSLPASHDAVRAGWSLSFCLDTRALTSSETLLSIPEVLTVTLRFAGTDPALHELDTRFGNYLHFPLPDGTCPVLECTLPDATPIGLPLGALPNPAALHSVCIRREATASWSVTIDNTLTDANGLVQKSVQWPSTPPKIEGLSPRITDPSFVAPPPPLAPTPDATPITRPIQFWTPDGTNSWVGDVVVGLFRDRFHLFYLYDRRHHGSKQGSGGHFFAHLSSADLIHWDEHPHVTSIDEWWITCGTGTPFVWNNQLYLSYGLHTTRFMPSEDTCEAALQDYFLQHGRMGDFAFNELPGFPIGGTYAVSSDGIHFTPSNRLFHSAQNPTVYNRTDGLLGCVNSYGGHHGMYISDTLTGWRMYDPDIPIDGDCPCEFEWNGHHYLIQGFHYMAYNPDGHIGGWTDWSRSGDDIYDGLSVPMVAPWHNNRRVLAGWINHPDGWGGWLALHELIQFPDGKLGSHWLPEAPPPSPPHSWQCPANSSLRIVFPNQDPAAPSLEFRLDAPLARAQWANTSDPSTPAPRQWTQAEWNASTDPDIHRQAHLCPNAAFEYAIQNIRGLDAPFLVRICAHFDPKSGCTLFDAEIAGSRTMICQRTGQFLPPTQP